MLMFQYCLNSVLKHAKRVYFAQYKKMLHNTKNFELILVYWFLQKRLFADSIKEKEKAELEKMKKKKENWHRRRLPFYVCPVCN